MKAIIRRAVPEDAEELLALLKTAGGETDNLTFGPEGLSITVEEEREFLAGQRESETSAFFVAEKDGRLVGNASFHGLTGPRLRHRGELGMSVLKAHWGEGIGSLLLEAVIDFAKNTAKAEILSLEVRGDNTRAIALYEKYGFEKIGQFKGFFKIDDQYVDFDLMNLFL